MTFRRGVDVARVEGAKLAAQPKVWAVLALCALAPFGFVEVVISQSGLPTDTLFGRFVKSSGFASPLVVLGFASQWAFPALASVVGGDVFAQEDRLGAWPTLLTRSATRAELFAGKTLAALVFSLLTLVLLGASSVTAGAWLVGRQPIVGLSGELLPAPEAMRAVTLAWASAIPPSLAFTAVAILASVITRSSAAGVGLPVVTGLAMQLVAMVNGPELVRRALLTTAFDAWHGLLAEPRFVRPLAQGLETSAAYFVACLAIAYGIQRRRDAGA